MDERPDRTPPGRPEQHPADGHVQFSPPEWLGTLSEQLAEVSERFAQVVDGLGESAQAVRQQLDAYLTENGDAIVSFVGGLERIREQWLTCTPPAWRELEADALFRVLSLGKETRVCLVWAPRHEIIAEALDAWDPNGGNASPVLGVLEEHRNEILDDLHSALGEVSASGVRGHVEATLFATEAVAAARDGHLYAAQALAAGGIGQVLHVIMDFPAMGGLGKAYKEFSAVDMDEATISVIKLSLIQSATAVALTNTKEADTAGFNRHGTLHGRREFFSDGNSLAALLLLVSWVRELQWVSDEFPEAIRDAQE